MSDGEFTEQGLRFNCEGDELVGVASVPQIATSLGVVIVVGGPQYRAGSHRQFVLLARGLARSGFCVLRFDYRGLGDSSGKRRTFEEIDADIRAAVDALASLCPGVSSIALWGLCDAASAVLFYASSDPRVHGLALANPWARAPQSYARVQLRHYYLRRLVSVEFWRKFLNGRFSLRRSAGELRQNVLQAAKSSATTGGDYRTRMLEGMRCFEGKVLLFLSGQDLTAREFELFMDSVPEGRNWLAANRVRRVDLPQSDHTFSRATWQQRVEDATLEWLRAICAGSLQAHPSGPAVSTNPQLGPDDLR